MNEREVWAFPFDFSRLGPEVAEALGTLSVTLMENLQSNSVMRSISYRRYGTLQVQVFAPRLSKPVVDNIDSLLAQHYSFTSEELDFIINYDIKYRMGEELFEDEEKDT